MSHVCAVTRGLRGELTRNGFASQKSGNPRTLPTAPRHSTRRLRVFKLAVTLLSPLVLAACGSLSGGGPPAQKEQARLEIAIEANRDLNLDLKGRGAPVLLRVYELKSDVAFQDADFFGLQNTDKAVLGSDLLAVDQFVIRPGETREIRRKSNPETTAIGIFAGYRDLPGAVWRIVHKMPAAPESAWYRAVVPSNKAKLKIDLQSNAILLTDEEVGQRPVQHANESLKGLEQSPQDGAKQQLDATTKMGSNLLKFPEKPSLGGMAKNPMDALK
jgi:type VI secretion system protein VasD